MAWVLDFSPVKVSSDRLVLLSLANHADALGRKAYPSVAQIAREVKKDERTVQRALNRLKDGGHITQEGTSHFATTIYAVVMTPPADCRGVTDDTGGGADDTQTVVKVGMNTHLHGLGVTGDTPLSLVPPETTPEQDKVMATLVSVANDRDLPGPRLDLVVKAMGAYPSVDHVAEADALEAWAANPKKQFANINSTYRAWLKRASEKPSQVRASEQSMKEEQLETVRAMKAKMGWS
jgi:hypothetical protein